MCTKRCPQCGQTLPTAFARNRTKRDGYQTYCRDCHRAHRAARRSIMGGAGRLGEVVTLEELEASLPGPLTGRLVAYVVHGRLVRIGELLDKSVGKSVSSTTGG